MIADIDGLIDSYYVAVRDLGALRDLSSALAKITVDVDDHRSFHGHKLSAMRRIDTMIEQAEGHLDGLRIRLGGTPD